MHLECLYYRYFKEENIGCISTPFDPGYLCTWKVLMCNHLRTNDQGLGMVVVLTFKDEQYPLKNAALPISEVIYHANIRFCDCIKSEKVLISLASSS